jgi:hypothetical protein
LVVVFNFVHSCALLLPFQPWCTHCCIISSFWLLSSLTHPWPFNNTSVTPISAVSGVCHTFLSFRWKTRLRFLGSRIPPWVPFQGRLNNAWRARPMSHTQLLCKTLQVDGGEMVWMGGYIWFVLHVSF